MDNIYIDTSIFEANNFLESKRINEILKLSEEGHIKIVLPELTYREIINRTRKNVAEAIQKFKKYRNDTKIFRNIESLKGKFNLIDEEQCNSELENTIESRFKKAKIEIVDYPTISIKEVFNSYFEKKFPFSKGIKKNEFPDAFALLSIEKWCKENNKKCLVFAKDEDMIQYESEHLEIIDDYEKYLSDKLKEIEKHNERLNLVQKAFEESTDNIIEQIKQWVHSELDDFSKYYDYSYFLEVHDVDIQRIDVDLEGYQITSITDEYIAIQSKVYIKYDVEIIIDDEDYAIKDYETKTWNFTETKPKLIDEIRYITVDLIFEIPPAGKEFAELEIEEINEGKNLKV